MSSTIRFTKTTEPATPAADKIFFWYDDADELFKYKNESGTVSALETLVALTANRAVVTNGSGFIAASATTATEIGYVSGVTSAIQTQIDGKQATGSYITALTGDVTATGPGSVAATIAAGAVDNSKVSASAAIAFTKLAAMTASRAAVSDVSGFLVPSATTAAEIGFVSGVTSAIQTQIDSKQATGNYITALTGDVTASGPGSVAATLASVGTAGTYVKVTTDAKGRVTAGTAGPLPIADGGTNASTALGNLKVMTSQSGSIKESAYLFTDDVNSWLGIGTTPSTILHVSTNTNPEIRLLRASTSGDAANNPHSSYYIGTSGTTGHGYVGLAGGTSGLITGSVIGDLCVRVDNTKRMLFSSGGTSTAILVGTNNKVGIGMDPTFVPAETLTVGSFGTDNGIMRFASTLGPTHYANMSVSYDSTNIYLNLTPMSDARASKINLGGGLIFPALVGPDPAISLVTHPGGNAYVIDMTTNNIDAGTNYIGVFVHPFSDGPSPDSVFGFKFNGLFGGGASVLVQQCALYVGSLTSGVINQGVYFANNPNGGSLASAAAVSISAIPGAGGNFTVDSTTGALIPSRMTTTQKNAVTPVNGMVLYDSTVNKINARENGAWVSFSTSTTVAGTYTPTLTNVANLDASTAYQCQYMRIDNVVTVSGKVDVDPTVTLTSTKLGISLPIASNIGSLQDVGGVAFANAIANQGAAVLGDSTNDRAQLEFIAVDTTNQSMYFTFTYEII